MVPWCPGTLQTKLAYFICVINTKSCLDGVTNGTELDDKIRIAATRSLCQTYIFTGTIPKFFNDIGVVAYEFLKLVLRFFHDVNG